MKVTLEEFDALPDEEKGQAELSPHQIKRWAKRKARLSRRYLKMFGRTSTMGSGALTGAYTDLFKQAHPGQASTTPSSIPSSISASPVGSVAPGTGQDAGSTMSPLDSYIMDMDIGVVPYAEEAPQMNLPPGVADLQQTHNITPLSDPFAGGGVTETPGVTEDTPEETGPGQTISPGYTSTSALAQFKAATNRLPGRGTRRPLTPQERLFGRGVNFTPSGASNPHLGYSRPGRPTMTISGTAGSTGLGYAGQLSRFMNR